MSWNTLHPTIQTTAQNVLTPKQLEAWKLELAGYGTRRIAEHLSISRASTIDRLDSAYRRLHAAGIRQDASGHYHQETAA